MDVAGGEMGGNTGQLKLLYPLLFGLQVMQLYTLSHHALTFDLQPLTLNPKP